VAVRLSSSVQATMVGLTLTWRTRRNQSVSALRIGLGVVAVH
jgi:hypothetical protein